MFPFLLPLAGGLVIGAACLILLKFNGRIAGISGISAGVLRGGRLADMGWRLAFLLGLVTGPVLLSLMTGHSAIGKPVTSMPVLALAGLLVGFGTALGGGCTSGHGVCGIARLSVRSFAATGTFMVFAILTVYVVRHVL